MAQLSVSDCKAYLRIQHTAEDTPLGVWLAQAIANVEAELARPIEPLERTWRIERPVETGHVAKLFVPVYPVAVADSAAGISDLVLTDGDGTTLIEDTDYRLDTRTGVITPIDSTGQPSCFSNFPYTITAWVGLAALAEFDARIEPVLNAAILDVVADRYQRRNPASTNEATGGDVSAAFTTFAPGLPQRVIDQLAPWRMAPVTG